MGKRKKKSCFLLLIETKYATAERCCSKDSFLFYSLFYFFVIIHRSSFFYRMPTKNRREIYLNIMPGCRSRTPPLLDSWPMQQRSKMIIIIIIEKKSKLDGGYCVRRLFSFYTTCADELQIPNSHFLTLILIMVLLYIAISFYFKWIWSHPRTFSTLLLFSCFTSVPVIFLRTSDG